jgi:lipopolysaccharide transport system ATP-binding protein
MSPSVESRPVITLHQAGVCYRLKRKIAGSNRYWALNDVTLEVRRGETLGILGSNGAGKSTLMKLMAGIVAPDRGTAWRDPNEKITLLSLGVGFESNLTGRENAILSALLLGLHRQTIDKRLDKIREFSELGEFFEQPVYTYSSGMMARLGFSVAMEVQPDVLLLDEVLSVGDHAFHEKSAQAIRGLMESERTVVLISHDMQTIRELCDRAVWVERGVTKATGTVDEVAALYLA